MILEDSLPVLAYQVQMSQRFDRKIRKDELQNLYGKASQTVLRYPYPVTPPQMIHHLFSVNLPSFIFDIFMFSLFTVFLLTCVLVLAVILPFIILMCLRFLALLGFWRRLRRKI